MADAACATCPVHGHEYRILKNHKGLAAEQQFELELLLLKMKYDCVLFKDGEEFQPESLL